MKTAGIDSCKYGWVAASYNDGQVLVFKTIAEILDHYKDDYAFLIDIPIGLSGENRNNRTCEKEARTALPANKKSSIFPVPCREALHAGSYNEANAINKAILGRGLSKQSWFIMPKIKEVDDLLIQDPDVRLQIHESHPEIGFQFLNGNAPLLYTKKTIEGIAERLSILTMHNHRSESLYKKALLQYKRNQVAKDDILDALCLALMQDVIHSQPNKYKMCRFASNPLHDEHGIEMAIYYGCTKQ